VCPKSALSVPSARLLGELHGHGADATGGTIDEHALPWLGLGLGLRLGLGFGFGLGVRLRLRLRVRVRVRVRVS